MGAKDKGKEQDTEKGLLAVNNTIRRSIMALAVCVKRCYDNQLGRHYYPNDQDDISPDHPLAHCFRFEEEEKPKFRRAAEIPVKEPKVFRPLPEDFGMVKEDPAVKAMYGDRDRPLGKNGKPLSIGAIKAMEAKKEKEVAKAIEESTFENVKEG